ncbi:hypothetical protein Pyn_38460 [Prunus yedoensis var. nudiflora]|uniref:Uncharacterized protein n=1 Tax=Prunus yedoensis var. nudiflora TaxID=2094558 RepID=A0A314YRR3_PRUYE|nr:hypothetical protein Pyn_38460 [Prunus yedoensis var. nudiflora]
MASSSALSSTPKLLAEEVLHPRQPFLPIWGHGWPLLLAPDDVPILEVPPSKAERSTKLFFKWATSLSGIPPSIEGPRTQESVATPSSLVQGEIMLGRTEPWISGRCLQTPYERLETELQQMWRYWRPLK